MSFESFNNIKFNLIIDLNKNSIVTDTPLFMQRSYTRVQWTNEENEKIVNHVKKFGPRNWKIIAAEIKTKNAQQCRDHYNDVLDPQINNGIWSKEEERILLLKYEQLGPQWAKIKQFLPGRTAGMIKNYINILLKTENIQNEGREIYYNKDFSDNITKKSNNNLSCYDIESLLNHS